jgi:hypothetical protein
VIELRCRLPTTARTDKGDSAMPTGYKRQRPLSNAPGEPAAPSAGNQTELLLKKVGDV